MPQMPSVMPYALANAHATLAYTHACMHVYTHVHAQMLDDADEPAPLLPWPGVAPPKARV